MSYFDKDGYVKLAVKQGKKQRTKKNVDYKNAVKEICLNCDSRKCNGNCKKIRTEIERLKRNG